MPGGVTLWKMGKGDRDWPQGTQHPKLFLWLQVYAQGLQSWLQTSQFALRGHASGLVEEPDM